MDSKALIFFIERLDKRISKINKIIWDDQVMPTLSGMDLLPPPNFLSEKDLDELKINLKHLSAEREELIKKLKSLTD